MNNDEKNRRLAELLHPEWCIRENKFAHMILPGATLAYYEKGYCKEIVPNFCGSLDAIKLIWDNLTPYQKGMVFSNLLGQQDAIDRGCPTWQILDATAEMWVDALLLTLGPHNMDTDKAKLKWKGWNSASKSGPYRVFFDGLVHQGDALAINGWAVGSQTWRALFTTGEKRGGLSLHKQLDICPTRDAAKAACESHHSEQKGE